MVSEKDNETHFKTCKLPELSSDTRFMTPKSDQKPIVIPSRDPPKENKTRNKTLDPITSNPSQRSESKNIVNCPYCQRNFSKRVADTHIPKCKYIINRPSKLGVTQRGAN